MVILGLALLIEVDFSIVAVVGWSICLFGGFLFLSRSSNVFCHAQVVIIPAEPGFVSLRALNFLSCVSTQLILVRDLFCVVLSRLASREVFVFGGCVLCELRTLHMREQVCVCI